MNGIFLLNSDYHKSHNTGVYRKIMAQIKIINEAGLHCEEIIQDAGRNDNEFIARIIHRLPFTNTTPKWELMEIFNKIDYIYFRRPSVMTGAMRRILKKIKRANPSVKIIMELSTFPYDHELKGIQNLTLLLKDKYNRKRLKGLVDRISVIDPTLSYRKIWGISAIPFLNGIDVDGISVRIPEEHKGIRILCVAYFSPWHGYERLIEGLYQYRKRNNSDIVYIDMVGEGPELEKYRKFVKDKNLEDSVIFWGRKTGSELNAFFDKSDIGAVGLNWYKYGYPIIGDLKSREYLSRGIPILISGKLDVEQVETSPYIYNVSADGTPIDIQRLVEYCHIIYKQKDKNQIAEDIHAYAKRNIDMKKVMSNIIDYITGE